ncbi:ribonuclease HI [bacterium]|nr:ribonuclease HI [bacterium]
MEPASPIHKSGIAWAYTDGACSGNPGIGGWAYLVAYQDLKKKLKIVEASDLEAKTTNNQMEMMAVLKVMRHLKQSGFEQDVKCYTDSSYVANGLNAWVFGWAKNGWRKKDGSDVANAEIWKNLMAAKKAFKSFELLVVPGHSEVLGNEYVDKLAVAAYEFKKGLGPREVKDGGKAVYEAFEKSPKLRSEMDQSASKSSSGSKKKALFYLSYVDGELQRHQTWSECEARVKGRGGARFKKVTAPEEEAVILKGWGL